MTAVELQMLADSTGGRLIGQSVALQGLAIDSRAVKGGELFAAIRGARVDGHEFAAKAMSSGAAALLTERRLEGLTPQLVVSDVTSASGTFALLKRRSFAGPVIAITGSAGKTTTKNLVSAAVSVAGSVHATLGNQNNELGVPLTLAGLNRQHQFAVIEMGAGQPGDIAYLCDVAEPDIAVCLNASAAHLAHFDSVDAIARTKGEIFQGLKGEGLAVINADQPWLSQWIQQAGGARHVTFGFSAQADYRAVHVKNHGLAGTQFQLHVKGVRVPVRLVLPGEQHVSNALAALAVAIELGVSPEQAADALLGVQVGAGRGEVRTGSIDYFNKNILPNQDACRKLNCYTFMNFKEIFSTKSIIGDKRWIGQMISYPLPKETNENIKSILLMDYRIEIPIFKWKNQTFIRSSIHVYNEKKDIDYLMGALKAICHT